MSVCACMVVPFGLSSIVAQELNFLHMLDKVSKALVMGREWVKALLPFIP